jgi:hypothetical protein
MTKHSADYKDNFQVLLQPMIDLFDYKKSILRQSEWMTFVTSTRERIIADPHQFLGHDLPPASVLGEIVLEIFRNYLEGHYQGN